MFGPALLFPPHATTHHTLHNTPRIHTHLPHLDYTIFPLLVWYAELGGLDYFFDSIVPTDLPAPHTRFTRALPAPHLPRPRTLPHPTPALPLPHTPHTPHYTTAAVPAGHLVCERTRTAPALAGHRRRGAARRDAAGCYYTPYLGRTVLPTLLCLVLFVGSSVALIADGSRLSAGAL